MMVMRMATKTHSLNNLNIAIESIRKVVNNQSN